MRSIAEVIDRVLAEVPADEGEVRKQLTKLREDSWFTPPEDRSRHFLDLGQIFYDRFGDVEPAPGWPMRVSEIVRGRA